MAESTLTLKWSDIQSEVGYALGYGRDATQWETNESGTTDLVTAFINSAVRKFYSAKDWNFLKVMVASELATVSGTQTYTLPDDFAGVIDQFTFDAGVQHPAIFPRPEATIRRLAQFATGNAPPYWFAIRPKGGVSGSTTGQRWEVLFYPIPDAVYNLSYKYSKIPDLFDNTNSIAWGGMYAGECIQELAIAEGLKKTNGPMDPEAQGHQAEAEKLIEELWARDKKYTAPAVIGYNGDPSTSPDEILLIRPAKYQ